MSNLPIRRVVLYKHGVGYFEREATITGDATLALMFKQAEVSDVLKSLTVLDLDGGHIASVSYDSTQPLSQLLQEVALSIPDRGSLVGLLPQIKGAHIALTAAGTPRVEGVLLGVDPVRVRTADGITVSQRVSLLTGPGVVQQFDLYELTSLEILDPSLRRDLDFYLRTLLSAKKKEARAFTLFARGEGERRVRISYTLAAPVWKATYRILFGAEGQPPFIQGWAVVDNTQDEDWEQVQLSLIAGLPVSFIHDLYTPRYIRRPTVEVQETTGVLPPVVESGMTVDSMLMAEDADSNEAIDLSMESVPQRRGLTLDQPLDSPLMGMAKAAISSTPTQVRERKLGDLFEYQIEHPVTIHRNQSALVPIVLREFEGRSVLLHNRHTRVTNPMRAVELKNTTGLTLEGGPLTVLESNNYVGEAMLDTLQPDELRLVPYAVELGVAVLDNVESWADKVHRVILRAGRLIQEVRRIEQRTYHFDNRSTKEQILYIDHPRHQGDWALADPPGPPLETTENYWRFRLALPARTVTPIVLRQQRIESQVQYLAGMDGQSLGYWLEERHLDDKTRKTLRQLVEELQRKETLEAQLGELQGERGRIEQEQQRIRDNLASLGERSSEKELRERFIRSLSKQEDRLETIETKVKELTRTLELARVRIASMIQALEYEGPME